MPAALRKGKDNPLAELGEASDAARGAPPADAKPAGGKAKAVSAINEMLSSRRPAAAPPLASLGPGEYRVPIYDNPRRDERFARTNETTTTSLSAPCAPSTVETLTPPRTPAACSAVASPER